MNIFLLIKYLSIQLSDHPTTITAPGPWDTRNLAPEINEPAQDIAYNAYKWSKLIF